MRSKTGFGKSVEAHITKAVANEQSNWQRRASSLFPIMQNK